MNRETDERIRLKGHGFGRELAVNPAYDGIRPKTRVDNRAVYDESSVGSFGAASEKITTMSQRYVEFAIPIQTVGTPVLNKLVMGAGSLTGINIGVLCQNAHPLIVQLLDGRNQSVLYSASLSTGDTGIRSNLTARFGDWGISFNDLILKTTVLGDVGTIMLNCGTVSIANTE